MADDLAGAVPRAACTRLLILQPTPFCNLDCSYCYLPGRSRTDRMEVATARRAAERLRADGLAGDALTVVWHAGEPLAVPRAFYEGAFAAIAEALGPDCRVTHAVQTNATLIDDAWCELFVRHRVRVGVSVDGPAALHDAHRRGRDGRGSHARVLQGLARLRAHGLAPHAIAVVTRAALEAPDAFFDFFAQQGFHELGCNFDEAEGVHGHSSLEGHEAAHAAFLERLLERSLLSGSTLVVRELAAALHRVAEPLPRFDAGALGGWPDNAQVQPLALVTVAWNGDFGSYSPELLGQRHDAFDDFVLGNVAREGYVEALARARSVRLWRAIAAGVTACEQRCAYFGLCGGGAPVNKLAEHGCLDSAETLYCRSMVQRPLQAVLRRLEAEREGERPASPRAPQPCAA